MQLMWDHQIDKVVVGEEVVIKRGSVLTMIE